MKNFIFIVVIMLNFSLGITSAQTRTSSYSREISMTFDNDIIFFIDFYYTAGQDLSYRRLAKPKSFFDRAFKATKTDSSKVIIALSGGYKIFTPFDIDFSDVKTMDRPYAGWSYVKLGISNFPSSTTSNKYEVESGLVGSRSGVGQLQRWVHNDLDFEVPAGWNSQIRNEFVVNVYYTRYKAIQLQDHLDVISQSAVEAGTGGNKLSQDFIFRALRFNSINNSAFTQSRLSWDNRALGKRKRNEFFLFFGAGLDYVLSNIFIQGSLFKDNKSVFTVPMKPIVFRQTFGVMFSSRSITWNITTVHLSTEVKKGRDHEYGSVGMAVRF